MKANESEKRNLNDDLSAKIANYIEAAYGLGYCHGLNHGLNDNGAYIGRRAQREEEGWGQYSERLHRDVVSLLEGSEGE